MVQGGNWPRRPLIDRFMAKVVWNGGEDECWEWEGTRTRLGYGMLSVGSRTAGTRKSRSAHRIAYELFVGPIPDGDDYHGVCVLHRCDNPPCCNPAHLFLGTHATNMSDMKAKGRGRGCEGEEHHQSKLTRQDILTIREWAPAGWSQRCLASAFGVDQRTIGRVLRMETWPNA